MLENCTCPDLQLGSRPDARLVLGVDGLHRDALLPQRCPRSKPVDRHTNGRVGGDRTQAAMGLRTHSRLGLPSANSEWASGTGMSMRSEGFAFMRGRRGRGLNWEATPAFS